MEYLKIQKEKMNDLLEGSSSLYSSYFQNMSKWSYYKMWSEKKMLLLKNNTANVKDDFTSTDYSLAVP